jgi:CDGSH-type Zn-finger protein
VFRPSEKPWIVADAATGDEIALTIDHCPSGALRYTRAVGGVARSVPTDGGVETSGPTTVTVHAQGPLEVRGEMTVVASDGTTLRESRRQYFCRCGHSGNKPFCDGSHNRVKFADDGLGVREA